MKMNNTFNLSNSDTLLQIEMITVRFDLTTALCISVCLSLSLCNCIVYMYCCLLNCINYLLQKASNLFISQQLYTLKRPILYLPLHDSFLWQLTFPSLLLWIVLFSIPHTYGVMKYRSLSYWVVSLNVMSSIHVVNEKLHFLLVYATFLYSSIYL